jgi:ribosome-associated protein
MRRPAIMVDENRPSKTQRKKAVHALQDLGVGLVELPEDRLAAIELPERLRDAVMDARRITAHEARRRQMQYIGKLMRTVDAEPIRAALDAWRAQSFGHTAAHKRIEGWRERLFSHDAALAELAAAYPLADAARLSALVRGALRERETNQPPRSYRELYQALRALIESRVTNKGDD